MARFQIPASTPYVGWICCSPRGFSPGTPVFPSPQKPTFPYSNSTRNQVDKEPQCGNTALKKSALYLSVNVFRRKYWLETVPPFYVVIQVTQRSNHLQGKGTTFISQSFLRPWVLVRSLFLVRFIYLLKRQICSYIGVFPCSQSYQVSCSSYLGNTDTSIMRTIGSVSLCRAVIKFWSNQAW